MGEIIMVYLLIKKTSDGYDDNTSWLIGAYSNKDKANEKKNALEKSRKLLEKRVEEGFVDFLYDDIVWYKVIDVEIDSKDFESIIL